jgi:hypothetical protein
MDSGHLATHAAAIASALNISAGAKAAARLSPPEDMPEIANNENNVSGGSSGREGTTPTITANVAAISKAVAKLQPLLLRAQKLRSARRQPVAASIDEGSLS